MKVIIFLVVILCSNAIADNVTETIDSLAENFTQTKNPHSCPFSRYFPKDAAMGIGSNLFDKSFLCTAGCVEVVLDKLSPTIRWDKTAAEFVSDMVNVICSQDKTFEQCLDPCPDGPLKSAVKSLWPLYDTICSPEFEVVKANMSCIISASEDISDCYKLQCPSNSSLIQAFGNSRTYLDYIRAIKNYPGDLCNVSTCHSDCFIGILESHSCNKDAISQVRKLFDRVNEIGVKILVNQLDVSKDKIPAQCNGQAKSGSSSVMLALVGLVQAFWIVKKVL